MFPSFNFDDNSMIKKSSNFPSDLHNPNSQLFNFPSPFLDEHESPLNQIFFQTLHHSSSHQIMSTTTTTTINHDPEKKRNTRIRRSAGVVPRRRTGKKDRHSKICTAQGVRDRRMRLSLQVARKFFDLQDMLGYDKASKTIEWLFTKSKKAIKDLINEANTTSTTNDVKSESLLSECEVVSGSAGHLHQDEINNNNNPKVETSSKSSTRESREKARARARSRTREKMMEKLALNPNYDQKLGFSPYDTSADVGTIEKFLGNSSSSSWPNINISDHNQNSSAVDFMGFFGNWDLSERSSSCMFPLAGNPNDDQFL